MISKSFTVLAATLSVAVLAALSAPAPSPTTVSFSVPSPTPVAVEAPPEEKRLSTEQAHLVEHLAQKYQKPESFMETTVLAAYKEAEAHKISPLLVLAIIEKESSFRHQVVNSYGAMGLMQVVPRWHPDKLSPFEPKSQLLDPEVNIRVGTRVLAEYLTEKKGNLSQALAKYSGGASTYYERVKQFERKLRDTVKSKLQDA